MDHASVQRVALLAGHGPARALLLAAEEIDVATALRLGLAQPAGGRPEADVATALRLGLAPVAAFAEHRPPRFEGR